MAFLAMCLWVRMFSLEKCWSNEVVLETGGGEEFHVINVRIVKRGSKQLCKLLLCFTPAPCHMLPLSGLASFTAATLLSNTLSSF